MAALVTMQDKYTRMKKLLFLLALLISTISYSQIVDYAKGKVYTGYVSVGKPSASPSPVSVIFEVGDSATNQAGMIARVKHRDSVMYPRLRGMTVYDLSNDSVYWWMAGAWKTWGAGGVGTVTRAVDTIWKSDNNDTIVFTINSQRYTILDKGSDEIINGINVGTGLELYKEKIDDDLLFRTILTDNTIQRIQNTNDVTLAVIPNTHIQRIQQYANGTLIGTRKAINIIGDDDVTVLGVDDPGNDRVNYTISATVGQTNTVSNLAGSGAGVYKQKVGVNFEFKRLVAGTNFTIEDMGDSLRLNASSQFVFNLLSTIQNADPLNNDSLVTIIGGNDSTIFIKGIKGRLGTKTVASSGTVFVESDTAMMTTNYNLYRYGDSIINLINPDNIVKLSTIQNGAPYTADSLVTTDGSDTIIVIKSVRAGPGLYNTLYGDTLIETNYNSFVLVNWDKLYQVIDSLPVAGVSTNIYTSSGTLSGIGDRVVTLGTRDLTFDASSSGGFNVNFSGSNASGDLFFLDSSGKWKQLPIGAQGKVLKVDNGFPSWGDDATGGGSGVTSVAMTVPTGLAVTGSPITTTGTLAITTALNGMVYGTGTGFAVATIASPLTYSAGTLDIQNASSIQEGSLTAADWNTFNNKQDLIGTAATTHYYRGDKTMQLLTSDVVTEGSTNLYFTNARARLAISAASPITYNSTTGQVGINVANTSQNGYLTSTNWNTFNNKQQAILFEDEGADLGTSGSTSTVDFIGAGVSAAYSAGKVTVTIGGGAGGEVNTASNLAGTGIGLYKTKVSSDLQFKRLYGIGPVTVTDFTDSVRISVSGVVTSVGLTMPSGFTVSSSPVTGSGTLAVSTTLNGIIAGNGSGFNTATISSPLLFSSNTLSIQNASSTLTGALTSTDWNTFNGKQDFIVAGTTAQYWRGDKTWQTLNTTVVPEGTNLYYTNTRARLAISATAPITYNNSTGVIAIGPSSGSTDGYLSAAHWTIFNAKMGSGSNVGTGIGKSFKQLAGPNAEFRSIASNSTIGITNGVNDITLVVNNNTSTQRVQVMDGGVAAGTRQTINFIEGTNVTITAADNVGADRVDVTINSTSGSTSLTNIVGTGAGVFRNEISNVSYLKRIVGGLGSEVTDMTDSISIKSQNFVNTDLAFFENRAHNQGLNQLTINGPGSTFEITPEQNAIMGVFYGTDVNNANGSAFTRYELNFTSGSYGSVTQRAIGDSGLVTVQYVTAPDGMRLIYSFDGASPATISEVYFERSGGNNIFPFTGTTDTLLYFNKSTGRVERKRVVIGGGGGTGTVTSVGMTVPVGLSVSGSPITTSGTLAITTSLNGLLRGTGSGFATTTVMAPLSFSGGILTIATASTTVTGALTNTDWNTFNSKINTASNLGTGAEVFKQKTGVNAEFRKINGTGGITVTQNANDITIDGGAVGGSGVTSVDLAMPSGFSVSGGPITTSGTLTVSTTLSGLIYGTGSGFGIVTLSGPLTYSAGTLGIALANGSTNGYLSSTNWTTFNNKIGSVVGLSTATSQSIVKSSTGGVATLKSISVGKSLSIVGNSDSLLIDLSSDSMTTASNGLNRVIKDIRLGGPLTQNTTVTLGVYNLTLTADNISDTANLTYGLFLRNGASATSTVMQASPGLFYHASGWKTASVAGARAVTVRNRVVPYPGSSETLFYYSWDYVFNNGTAYQNLARLWNNGGLQLGVTGGVSLSSATPQTGTILTGAFLYFNTTSVSQPTAYFFNVNSGFQQTTGNTNVMLIGNGDIAGGFNPTSGSATHTGIRLGIVINQTGSASGETFGFHDDAVVTSAVLYNSFYAKTGRIRAAPSVAKWASIHIPVGIAPTTPNNGDIWHEANHIKARLNGVTVNLDDVGGGGGGGTVSSVALAVPSGFTVSGSPVTTTGTLTIATTLNGIIRGTGTGFTTTTITAPLVFSGTALSITQATAATNGYLTLTDWNTFNNKVNTGSNLAAGAQVFKQKSGVDMQFRTIRGTGGTTVTQVGDSIVINSSAGGGSGTVTSVALAVPAGLTVSGSPVTTAGTITIGTTLNGMIYGTGSGFAVASVNAPLLFSGGAISIQVGNTSQSGYITSIDWNIFNNKVGALINGLTLVGTTGELGGSLTKNTTISAGASFQLAVTGTGSTVFSVSSSTGVAINAAASGSGTAVSGISTSGYGGLFGVNSSSTNTVLDVMQVERASTGTAANGIGVAIRLGAETSTNTMQLANRIVSTWTVATHATRSSTLSIEGVNNGTVFTGFEMLSTGQMRFNQYGTTDFPGAVHKMLAVTTTGNVIETVDNTVHTEKTSVDNEGTWAFARGNGTGALIDQVLRVGHLTDNSYRSITVNIVPFILTSSITSSVWMKVGNIPSTYRPNNTITGPLVLSVDGDQYATPLGVAFTNTYSSDVYARYRIKPNGDVEVFVGTVFSSIISGGQSFSVFPIHVTYFIIPGD